MPYKDKVKQREAQKRRERDLLQLPKYMWRDARNRILGRTKNPQYYAGCALMLPHAFVKWVLDNPDYYMLHANWVASNYQTKYRPSVDRFDSTKGYERGNIQLVPYGENLKRAGYKNKR